MTANENWRTVKGFTRYEVSDRGNVRNKHTKVAKAIRGTPTGYRITDLKENGEKHTKYIHRLVAEAFLDNPLDLPHVNHKDEDKANNSVENLEWCSVSQNNSYNGRAKRIGMHHREHHPLCKAVRCVETGVVYRSVREAGRHTSICSMGISYCLNGKQKSAGGYRWEVVADGDY